MIAEVERAIEQHVQANWHATDIDFDNVLYKPVIGITFIRLQIEWSTTHRIGISRNRIVGNILFSIFTPYDKGSLQAALLSDDIVVMMEGLSFANLSILPGTSVRIGQNKGWYQRNVDIPITYDNC